MAETSPAKPPLPSPRRPFETKPRSRPPFAVDLNTVPSLMEQIAARWSSNRDD